MSGDPIVEVESGKLSGVVSADGAVHAFKGIPYAAPPVGPLRWKPPQRPLKWSGVRPAKAFGAVGVQPSRPGNSISHFGDDEPQSEDCLFLNVWAPAKRPDQPAPVMVYFHGGAFFVGSGSSPLFDQGNLARRGVVIVTVNYRLGRLGFLAHPALSAESPAKASGNYGIMDQIASLEWVQRNIAAFGGDPNRVTVFGQSVGSMMAVTMQLSPLAKGVFHRVIGQSGSMFGPVRESSVTGDSLQSLDYAEASGVKLANRYGARTADELRALPLDKLQLVRDDGGDSSNAGRGTFDTSWIIVDGHVIPDDPTKIFAQGRQNDVPVMTGSVANEAATMPSSSTLAGYIAQAREDFGPEADRFLKLFPATNDAQAVDASRNAFAYRNFIWQNWTWARMQSRTGKSPVYYYRFNHEPPIPPGEVFAENVAPKMKAYHCSELHYIFETFDLRRWPWGADDKRMADVMTGYWTTFAATGNPNGKRLPEWPAFDEKTQQTMYLKPSPEAKPPFDAAALAFWEDFYAGQRRSLQG